MTLMPNEVLVMREPTWESLPDPEVPYFALTKDGYYLRKRTLFGDATVPIKASPDSLIKPESQGQFLQNDLKYPMWLILQAHDFFKKVLERHHSEAAVIVTYSMRENKFSLFIPEQYVSYGGVHQKYNPEHLRDGWYAVGTIHSHCDFGAFHSGTDTHDADEMDGLHMTIGMIGKPNGPQVATMIAMNKTMFHIKFEEGCDIEARGTEREETAPEWWFKFLHVNQPAPWIKTTQPVHTHNGVNPNFGFQQPKVTPAANTVGERSLKTASGDTIIIPKVLPDGYADWGEWWRKNGKQQVKPASTQVSLWNENDWETWWSETMRLAGDDFEALTGDEIVESPEGPFEQNAKLIAEADKILRSAAAMLDKSGFRLSYGIVYAGTNRSQNDA